MWVSLLVDSPGKEADWVIEWDLGFQSLSPNVGGTGI